MMNDEMRMALAKVAYEEFASQRVALGHAMPPWQLGPGALNGQLPEEEREIWARVAEAVAAVIPFVITDEVRRAAWGAVPGDPEPHDVGHAVRVAALAAGFRVEER